MSENAGLYQKFDVRRRDGRDQQGRDREGAAYFVLDVVHDPHALAALRAYRDSCRAELPELAEALDGLLAEEQDGVPFSGPYHQALRTPRP